MKAKTKGLTSRNQVLENEIKTVKTEQETSKKLLIEKSKNDDSYIKALKSETSKLKNEVEKLKIETQFGMTKKDGLSGVSLSQEVEKLRKENYQLFRELEKKNATIDDINRSSAFSIRSEAEFKPLKEDLSLKVTKLQSRIRELEASTFKSNNENINQNSV